MSAGEFTKSFYEADNGDIHPIRVQPETISASIGSANAAPAGPATVGLFAKVSKGRREYGLGARKVNITFTAAVPDNYADGSKTTIPILTKAVFDAIEPNATTGTYLGLPVIVTNKVGESKK